MVCGFIRAWSLLVDGLAAESCTPGEDVQSVQVQEGLSLAVRSEVEVVVVFQFFKASFL